MGCVVDGIEVSLRMRDGGEKVGAEGVVGFERGPKVGVWGGDLRLTRKTSLT